MPEYRTRTGIEIARAGNYDLSTGPFEFTREQFASAVANAEKFTPRIKLGHVDPRFDGEPSLGRVQNMRLAEDGDVLVADLVDVPAWLDDALGNAYPGRSIEASTNAEGTDMRVTALSLLGVTRPGIDTLADLEVALAAAAADRPTDPDVVEVAVSITQLRASAPGTQDPPAAASADEPHTERTPMDEAARKALAAKFGLDPETATEDEVNQAAIADAVAALPTTTPTTEPAAPVEPAGVLAPEPATAPVTVAVPVAASTAPAPGTVVVDEQRLAALEAAESARQVEDRNRVLASAMTEGRFSPARHQHYLAAWEADPDGTRVLLTASSSDGGLAPNTVPVRERGANPASQTSQSLNRALAASGLTTTPKGA